MKTGMVGNKLVLNHEIVNVSVASIKINTLDNCIYEVIRIVNYVPLFFEEHFHRLNNSQISLGVVCDFTLQQMKTDLICLINNAHIESGNIRVDMHWSNNQCNILVYQISHSYPSNKLYKTGIIMKSFGVERANPNIKQASVNAVVRNNIKSILSNDIYEVLLFNHLNLVTEGSKSNILFIKEQTIFSPPAKDILEGITRNKIIFLSGRLGYKVISTKIPFDSIFDFDACFITGTSPKVLPVCRIDEILFNPKHHIISELMNAYQKEIDLYCEKFTVK